MTSKLKLNEVVLTSPNGLVEKSLTMGDDGIVKVNGVQVADIVSGTFIPEAIGSVTAGVGTYTTRLGRYTKIGNIVTLDVNVAWTAHTGSGNIRVINLPFVSKNDGMFAFGQVFADMLTFTGNLICGIVPNTSQLVLYRILSNTNLDGVAMDTSSWIQLSITYTV